MLNFDYVRSEEFGESKRISKILTHLIRLVLYILMYKVEFFVILLKLCTRRRLLSRCFFMLKNIFLKQRIQQKLEKNVSWLLQSIYNASLWHLFFIDFNSMVPATGIDTVIQGFLDCVCRFLSNKCKCGFIQSWSTTITMYCLVSAMIISSRLAQKKIITQVNWIFTSFLARYFRAFSFWFFLSINN